MCGIAGIVGDPTGVDRSALLAALHHRGPDHQGSVSPAEGMWLCAARLAISDPRPEANQPMVTSDGRFTIVYNGEIYNARELRTRLELLGQRFRTRCDTEVILEGYRAFGDRVTDELDGMFAFALWDQPQRRLLLARDALGIKPLWLSRRGARTVFASEVRALLRSGAVDARISTPAVASFLAAGSVAEPHAIVSGVEALAPGHRLVLGDGGERCTRWFALPERTIELAAGEAVRQVRAALDHSVRGALTADVPVALLLSGGIDSTALAMIAGRGANLCSFHVRTSDGAANRAAMLARSLGLTHQEVRLTDEDVRNGLPALLAAQDQPSVDGANSYFIARAIHAAGIKSAISGLGADELFLGYPLHRTYVRARTAARLLRGSAAPLRLAARFGGWARARQRFGGWRLDKAFGVAGATGAAATYAAARALFPDAAVARLIPGLLRELPAERVRLPDSVSPIGEVTRLDLSTYLVNTLLRDTDVMSMAHGVELRVPMLDRRLVELVVALPDSLKVQAGRKKPLLVDAVPELPRELPRAHKEGFELPVEHWLLGPLRAQVESVLHSESACARVGIAPDAAAAVWQRFLGGHDRPSAFRAWAIYALCEWAQSHRAQVA